VAAAKGSGSEGGPHAGIASSAVTDDRECVRQRLLALAGMWLLLGGLLTALSLVLVFLAATAVSLLVLLALGATRLLRRVSLRTQVGALSTRIPRPRVRAPARHLGARAWAMAAAASGRTEALAVRALRAYALAAYRLTSFTGRSLARLQRHQAAGRRRAIELNELGAQLRREGAHTQAAEQHRVALQIVRDLGDPQAEALTLNSLALALAHDGAAPAAVQYLEEARDVLRELGDEEHEGRVIANLGVVYQRQGQKEEAVTLFQEALEKLPPASPAYRRVEHELSRAS
jgi:tetratricopeptide (TPR) repeat protein